MEYRINVFWRAALPDGRAADLLSQIAQLGIGRVRQVQVSDLYFVRGDLSSEELAQLANELLADPIVEGFEYQAVDKMPVTGHSTQGDIGHIIEIGFHPGVTDPVARHLLYRTRHLGIGSVEAAATGKRYTLKGNLTDRDLHCIARELLCNEVIQTYALGFLQPAFIPFAEPSARVEIVPIRDTDDPALTQMSIDRVLFLSLDEMRAIRDEFRRLGRDPTDVELETLAQTWSEHCQHKAFKSKIEYICAEGTTRVLPSRQTAPIADDTDAWESFSEQRSPQHEKINGLLPTYIRAVTERLEPEWVRSAFVDNAGIVDFDDEHEISFKVETHNHPSALEPFGGANTGVGGVIRDILGVSARPIANTDVLCFGPLDMSREDMPDGILHPRRIARGVVDGVEDYGNKMGIPTVSGALLYDPGYAANPLVYCGCVGIACKGQHRNHPQPGDLCVALGGRTGRDGLHGATFSSAELTHETGATVGTVVQIGDPITEKAVQEAVILARDEELYTAITDCGAGGFSSAIGEMGSKIGVQVELKDVRLKYPGLRPWEIWLSEAQERMVMAVPSQNLKRLQDICDHLDVEWTVIGHFTGDGRLCVKYDGRIAADLDMHFVHDGWPQPNLRAEWMPSPEHQAVELYHTSSVKRQTSSVPEPRSTQNVGHHLTGDLTCLLVRMLAHPDIASKEDVIRRYDHEVQGATVIKPLVGIENDGPSDAAVIRPLVAKGWKGLALGCGISPHYGRVDPYLMAWAAIDEAVRNVVAVGADPKRIALLDNFCWGNPALPDRLGGLVRAAQGCHDAALAYGTPFISGKDSLNNEYIDPQGQKRAIPPTLLISSLGTVSDVRQCVTMDLKESGDLLYIVGETRNEMGASLCVRLNEDSDHISTQARLPSPVPDAIKTMCALHETIQKGLVRACHDLSEGGLAVAAAEMAIAGRKGLQLELGSLPRADDVDADTIALFSESSARFLVQVSPQAVQAFEQTLSGRPIAQVGCVTDDAKMRVRGLYGESVINCPIADLRHAWQSTEMV
ncbi:MAG: phosphoribosylformylglycinamidine synthase subunit PurL [Anaerolineae bacterium]|nr:phosphoribosylformylglycinamidine synthase subunit PurL [Anaerolineae bacterium]